MVKEDIETVIDRLLTFVQANKETTLEKSAQAMALPQAQVEKLALLLEENGLLTIKYSLTSTKLLSKEFTDSQLVKGKKKLESKKDDIIKESEEAEREVLTAETLLAFIERDITRRLQVAEKLLVDLESKKDYSKEDYEFLEKELRLILQQAAMFEDEVAKLTAREAELRKLVTEFQARLDALTAAEMAANAAARNAGISSRAIAALRGLLAKIREILFSLFKRKAKQPATAEAAAAASPSEAVEKQRQEAREKQKQELVAVAPVAAPAAKNEEADSVPKPRAQQRGSSIQRVEDAFGKIENGMKNKVKKIGKKATGK